MKRTTKITGIVIGAAAAVAAVAWMLKDRLVRRMPTRAEPAPAPVFRVTPAAVAPRPDADDLSAIRGIGPVFKARLATAGISRFDELAVLEPARLADLAGVAESRAREWIDQARSLV
jgi:predicted flap endonuclease-1-like 5' DNA nuclease